MVVISQSPSLSSENLQLFFTTDSLLSNDSVLIFYGTSKTSNANPASSARIQSHVFTPAGLRSYPRLLISPNSPNYTAVKCLPREDQGDEVCRALAFSLLKYFSELSEPAKDAWIQQSLSTNKPSSALRLFSESHAADLASRMVQAVNAEEASRHVDTALMLQSLSHIDADVILPRDSVCINSDVRNSSDEFNTIDEVMIGRYGTYASLIKLFGEQAFLPTSKIRRAPSRASVVNRTNVFTRKQKEKLRLEMCELVDTEDRYVSKIYDLVHSIAAELREKVNVQNARSSSPCTDALGCLFPPCLDDILNVNTQFLDASRMILEETETTAIEDIETTTDHFTTSIVSGTGSTLDVSGIVAFANCLLTWFPKFATCYGSYIQAHSHFGKYLRLVMNDSGSSIANRIHETGEQRMMSMLIEPIQRLPRYSLYIDNIINQLPMKHPALTSLLKAKDVIADICAHDSPTSPKSRNARLCQMIQFWPVDFQPMARLITAADVVLLQSPYDKKSSQEKLSACLLLLFAGTLVLIRKTSHNALSARSLLSKLDSPWSSTKVEGAQGQNSGLKFERQFSLNAINFAEIHDGSAIIVTPSGLHSPHSRKQDSVNGRYDSHTRVYNLQGSFEGKASRWTGDIAKARVEGRFLESERENAKWEVRMSEDDGLGLAIFAAVYEEDVRKRESEERETSSITIVIDPDRCVRKVRGGQHGVEIVASISVEGDGFYRLSVETPQNTPTSELVTEAHLLSVLTKRLASSLQMRSQMRNPLVATYLLQNNQDILSSIKLSIDKPQLSPAKQKQLRPPSPIKAISNLFAGGSSRENPTSKRQESQMPVLGGVHPALTPYAFIKPTSESESSRRPVRSRSKINMIGNISESFDPIQALENTLSSYVLALHARKGNVIGRVVSNRTAADERLVHDLYNLLLEQPTNHELAAQAPVDVLFAAFEKFIKTAWKEKIGPVIETHLLREMQAKSEALTPLEFDDYFAKAFGDLSPQNQRALKSIIALLANLLHGMGSDGDRGTLTAVITEIVVCDEDPYMFIPFFDRLVGECEFLPDENGISSASTPSFGTPTLVESPAIDTGSMASKASSISKRLGIGSLHRENSKTDSNSRVNSILRHWSKGSRPTEVATKRPMERTKSAPLDTDMSVPRPSRQIGHPTIFDTFPKQALTSTPLGPVLGDVDLGSPFSSHVLNKSSRTPKKTARRSSLSDLKPPQTPLDKSLEATASTVISDRPPQLPKPAQASPFTPNTTFNASVQTPSRVSSVRYESPGRKENTPPVPQRYHTLRERPNVLRSDDRKRHANTLSTPDALLQRRSPSLIPVAVPKGVLSERPNASNTPPPVPSKDDQYEGGSSPTKLRVQSPRKVQQRLQNQQRTIRSTESTLQSELDNIGAQFSKLNVPSTIDNSNTSSTSPPQRRHDIMVMTNLGTKVKALESKMTHLIGNLQGQTTILEADMADTLLVAERKVKMLDEQLKQTNEENCALYERNNEELMRVFNQVRHGQGLEEMKAKLKESTEEAARWKRECSKLRRENAGLRAAIGQETGVVSAVLGSAAVRKDGTQTLR